MELRRYMLQLYNYTTHKNNLLYPGENLSISWIKNYLYDCQFQCALANLLTNNEFSSVGDNSQLAEPHRSSLLDLTCMSTSISNFTQFQSFSHSVGILKNSIFEFFSANFFKLRIFHGVIKVVAEMKMRSTSDDDEKSNFHVSILKILLAPSEFSPSH